MSLFTKQTDLSRSKTNLPKRKCSWRDKSGDLNEQTHISIYKIDNKEGPTVSTGDSVFCDSLYKKRI